jgi:hypothetical protein
MQVHMYLIWGARIDIFHISGNMENIDPNFIWKRA